jgi:hypothetical protein
MQMRITTFPVFHFNMLPILTWDYRVLSGGTHGNQEKTSVIIYLLRLLFACFVISKVKEFLLSQW